MAMQATFDASAAPREIAPAKSALVVFLCWLAVFAEGYDIGVLGAILPSLAADPVWQLTPLQLGAMGSYTIFGMLIGGIVISTLSELYGRKPMFIFCIGLFALCMVVSATAPTPAVFGASRFVAGLGLGGLIPCAAAITTEFSPARRKSLNYGIMYSGYSLGILAAALISRGFVEAHGWRAMVMLGAVPVLTLPLFIWLMPESLEWLVARGKTEKARALAERFGMELPKEIKRTGHVGIREVLGRIFAREKAFETACFWIALFMGLMLVYGLGQWLPQIMRKSGYDLGNSLLFLAVFSLSSAIGGILLGRIADRIGVRRAVSASYALGAIGIGALAFGGPILVNYALVAVAGFGTIAASLVLTGYLAQRLDPRIRAAGTGWALSFARIGALSGPLLGGVIGTLELAPSWNFWAFSLVALLAALATALIPARRVAA